MQADTTLVVYAVDTAIVKENKKPAPVTVVTQQYKNVRSGADGAPFIFVKCYNHNGADQLTRGAQHSTSFLRDILQQRSMATILQQRSMLN